MKRAQVKHKSSQINEFEQNSAYLMKLLGFIFSFNFLRLPRFRWALFWWEEDFAFRFFWSLKFNLEMPNGEIKTLDLREPPKM